MAVAAVNLTIDKGTDFSLAMKIKTDGAVVNLAGYGFSCVMKKHSAANVGYAFTVTALAPTTDGILKLQMPKAVTKTLNPGRYYYDLLFTLPTSGDTLKYAEGNVIVKGTAS
jgi:hypothetical protein